MIVYLATEGYTDTVTMLLPNWLKAIRRRIQILEYHRLPNLAELPAATYIFTDFERMTPDQLALAQQVWDCLRENRPDLRLLNEPNRALSRFNLLRTLSERGINPYRVFRVHELDDSVRYPVFVRRENDHHGARTGLISAAEELHESILEAVQGGVAIEELMIVEFFDTLEDGGYTMIAVSRFGDEVVPRHHIRGPHWMVKAPDVRKGDRWTPEQAKAEFDYLHLPCAPVLEEVFDIAGLDYGRMDFAIHNGQLAVWEINSNPILLPVPDRILPERVASVERMRNLVVEAFERIDHPGPMRPGVRLKLFIPALRANGSEVGAA